MYVTIQVSLRKKNHESEKAKLVEAGITTPWLENRWYQFFLSSYGKGGTIYTYLAGAHGYRNSVCNLIVNADQFVSIVAMHKINPNLTIAQLLKTIKLNKRNTTMLINHGYGKELNLI